SHARITGDALELSVQNLPVPLRGKTLEFFPETAEVIETAAPYTQAWKGAVWTARLPLAAQRSASPNPVPGVLADGGRGWRTELRVLGTWPSVMAPATGSPALEAALRDNAQQAHAPTSLSWWTALLGALLGGMLLNLMPCVFPVLA